MRNYEADPNFFDHVHSPEEFRREDRNKQAVEALRDEIASSIASAKEKRAKLMESSSMVVAGFARERHGSIISMLHFLEQQQTVTLHKLNQILEEW